MPALFIVPHQQKQLYPTNNNKAMIIKPTRRLLTTIMKSIPIATKKAMKPIIFFTPDDILFPITLFYLTLLYVFSRKKFCFPCQSAAVSCPSSGKAISTTSASDISPFSGSFSFVNLSTRSGIISSILVTVS